MESLKKRAASVKDWCQAYLVCVLGHRVPRTLLFRRIVAAENGCARLDWITGTGDLVGITAVFSAEKTGFEASCSSLLSPYPFLRK